MTTQPSPSLTGSQPYRIVVRRETTTSDDSANRARLSARPADQAVAKNRVVVKAPSGAVAGGALGCIAGLGALAIPGMGSFSAGTPLIVILLGATAGSILGTLADWVRA